MTILDKMYISGKPASKGSGGSLKRWMVFLLSHLGFAFALTCLYLGDRGIMRLGGFVARGGPYEIAHRAPGWVWIMPVSLLLCFILAFISFIAGKGISGFNLMTLSWSALFISVGWNFLEFGFSPPGGQNLAWGWIICGLVFVPIGAVPLWIIVQMARSTWRSQKKLSSIEAATESAQKHPKWGRSLLLQLIFIGLGIYLGIVFFNSLARPHQLKIANVKQKSIQESTPDRQSNQGVTVNLQTQGRTLALVAKPDGGWRIRFEGQMYERISDLPVDARRLFKKSLESLKGVER